MSSAQRCGYRSIWHNPGRRPLLSGALQRTLIFSRLLRRLATQSKSRAGTDALFRKISWAARTSVCIGMRARPSRFSVASREPSRTLPFGWLFFPLLENGLSFLPLSAFSLSLFAFFFPSLDTSGLDFFFPALLLSAMMGFFVLSVSVWNTAYVGF